MSPLGTDLDEVAGRTGFSGVVRVQHGEVLEVDRAYGLRDRAHDLAMTTGTQLALASGGKTFTALTVLSLVADGLLALTDPVRPLLGANLQLIDDEVTVEHLLAHRSGIGDYLDESLAIGPTEYVLSVPIHELAETVGYLPMLDGHPQVTPPGETFAYNNGAFVVLALVAERITGRSFHDLVEERVCDLAGLTDTGYLRSDELPGRAAAGYLGSDTDRTNVLHLPVRGSGDGGIYSTVGDVQALWEGLFDGRLLPEAYVRDLVSARSRGVGEEALDYGLGIWLHPGTSRAEMHGYDAGVSFRSVHDPRVGSTWTVISNVTGGTWPMEEVLDQVIGD